MTKRGKRWRRAPRRYDRMFDRILAVIEAGSTLSAFAQSIGVDVAAVSNFIRRDPDRSARYQAARAAGGLKSWRISESVYTRALRALASTDHPHQKHWSEPGLPNLDTMRARGRRDPSFQKRLDAALELRRRRIKPNRFKAVDFDRALSMIGQHSGKTQQEIDPLLRAALLPSIEAIRGRARRVPAFDEGYRRLNETRGNVRHPPESYQSALAALRADPHTATYRILPKRVGLIPAWAQLRLHLKRDAAFADQYRAVMEERRIVRGRALPSIRRARPFGFITTSMPADLVSRAQAAIPRWVDPALRDDIRSEIVLAILSGDYAASAISEAAQKIAVRMTGRREHVAFSLDATVGEGGASFLDLTTSDRYTFEDAI